jgi:hypothetical protein
LGVFEFSPGGAMGLYAKDWGAEGKVEELDGVQGVMGVGFPYINPTYGDRSSP